MGLDLKLHRVKLSSKFSRGEMTAGGIWICHMLEDTYRPPPALKVPGQTCIPVGVYKVETTFSPKFGKPMPLVYNFVTADGRKLCISADGKHTFEGVRLHAGNKVDHTEGCPLTGSGYREFNAADGSLMCETSESVLAFNKLNALILAEEARKGQITLTVTV